MGMLLSGSTGCLERTDWAAPTGAGRHRLVLREMHCVERDSTSGQRARSMICTRHLRLEAQAKSFHLVDGDELRRSGACDAAFREQLTAQALRYVSEQGDKSAMSQLTCGPM